MDVDGHLNLLCKSLNKKIGGQDVKFHQMAKYYRKYTAVIIYGLHSPVNHNQQCISVISQWSNVKVLSNGLVYRTQSETEYKLIMVIA